MDNTLLAISAISSVLEPSTSVLIDYGMYPGGDFRTHLPMELKVRGMGVQLLIVGGPTFLISQYLLLPQLGRNYTFLATPVIAFLLVNMIVRPMLERNAPSPPSTY